MTPHSLSAKTVHWGFAGLLIYAWTKQLDEVEELEDLALLRQEMAFLGIRSIDAPLRKLERWSASLTGEQSVRAVPDLRFQEFDALAKRLLYAFERMRDGVEKEKLFLRHASHELRTPIAILSANLVRNAFQYTVGGAVRIVVESSQVSVQNANAAELEVIEATQSDDDYGFGLGLELVELICRRLGWRCEVNELPGGRNTMVLFGDTSRTAAAKPADNC